MKIVHINGYFKEDVVYQENLLTIGQAEFGHDVYLLSSCFEPEMNINIKKRKHKPGVYTYKNVTVVRIEEFIELKKNALILYKGLFKKIKEINPDLIFFHDCSFVLFRAVAYKWFNRNVIYHIDFHSDESNSMNSSIGVIYHFIWRIYFKIFSKQFSRFFCVSPEVVDFVENIYKIPRYSLEHLPLPGEIFNDDVHGSIKDRFRKNNGFKITDILLVHTGKMPKNKETKLVLETFIDLKNSNYRLLIAGSVDEDFKEEFNQYLKSDNRIFYFGWLNPDNMKELLVSSDLLVQPGSLSNIFLTAICCGLPILIDDTPQGRYLTSFGNGKLIKKKTVLDLKDLLIQMTSKEMLLFHKNSSIIASHHFDYKNIAKISLS